MSYVLRLTIHEKVEGEQRREIVDWTVALDTREEVFAELDAMFTDLEELSWEADDDGG